MRHAFESFLLAPLFLLVLFLAPAGAAESDAARLLRIPVLFITDRNLEPGRSGEVNFGPRRKYIDDCKHDPYMGSAYFVLANNDRKQLTETLKNLGWSPAEKADKEGLFKITPIDSGSFENIQKDFYGLVRDKASVPADKNVFVFMHGYKNSFQSALHTAARMAYDAERPVILYSWPSAAKVRLYSNDENNVEWSQEHFNDFVTHLGQLCSDNPSIKVRMFAHSMGSRLLVRATPLLREKSFVLEAGLICPDVDDGLVKHYARRYLSVKGTTEIRLYMSRRDKALALSQLIHGGYTRLGEQADALQGWVGKIFTGQPGSTPAKPARAEEAEFQERLSETKKRMQTIDFTQIDRGLLGHNVPTKLICSMSFTNTPGPGLELVDEKSGLRSRMSNVFTRLAKLEDPSGTSQITGNVLRVVKTTPLKHKDAPTDKAKMQPAQQ